MITTILKLFFIGVLLISAMAKWTDFRNVAIFIHVTYQLPITVSTILLLLLILFEIVISILVWREDYSNPVIYYALLFVFILFIIINVFLNMSDIANCGCFGTTFNVHPKISLIKCVFLVIILRYLKYHQVQRAKCQNVI